MISLQLGLLLGVTFSPGRKQWWESLWGKLPCQVTLAREAETGQRLAGRSTEEGKLSSTVQDARGGLWKRRAEKLPWPVCLSRS